MHTLSLRCIVLRNEFYAAERLSVYCNACTSCTTPAVGAVCLMMDVTHSVIPCTQPESALFSAVCTVVTALILSAKLYSRLFVAALGRLCIYHTTHGILGAAARLWARRGLLVATTPALLNQPLKASCSWLRAYWSDCRREGRSRHSNGSTCIVELILTPPYTNIAANMRYVFEKGEKKL